jgi:hypothetical protein
MMHASVYTPCIYGLPGRGIMLAVLLVFVKLACKAAELPHQQYALPSGLEISHFERPVKTQVISPFSKIGDCSISGCLLTCGTDMYDLYPVIADGSGVRIVLSSGGYFDQNMYRYDLIVNVTDCGSPPASDLVWYRPSTSSMSESDVYQYDISGSQSYLGKYDSTSWQFGLLTESNQVRPVLRVMFTGGELCSDVGGDSALTLYLGCDLAYPANGMYSAFDEPEPCQCEDIIIYLISLSFTN